MKGPYNVFGTFVSEARWRGGKAKRFLHCQGAGQTGGDKQVQNRPLSVLKAGKKKEKDVSLQKGGSRINIMIKERKRVIIYPQHT